MTLRLVQTLVDNINLRETKEVTHENAFDLNVSVRYPEDKDNIFCVSFKIELKLNPNFLLSVKSNSFFETSEAISDEFKSSSFPVVNAPAIAFPFLRSFISTLMLNAGHNPVILPAINFVTLHEQNRNKNAETNFGALSE